MIDFLKFLIYFPDQGIIYLKEKNLKKTYLNLFKVFFYHNTGKYNKIIILRDLIYKILSILYLIPTLFLYLFNYRFVASDSKSIGTYAEELDYILANKPNYKLILLQPNCYAANKYFVDIFFKKKFIILKSNIICFLLIPFTYINLISLSPYRNKNNLIFQRQFYYKEKNKSYIFDHELLFKGRLISKKKDTFSHLKNINKKSKKKKCFLHLRNEKNLNLRNANILNYKESINFLIKNNFEIYYFSKKNPNINFENFYFFDLNLEKNKKYQINIIPEIDLYLGQISGPFHLFHFLEKNMILTDNVIFNHLVSNKNIIGLFKKYIKNNKYLNLKEILNDNLECIWDKKILQEKNIDVEDNTSDEILRACMEYLETNFIKNFNNENKIYQNYLLTNFISKSFIKKTNFL